MLAAGCIGTGGQEYIGDQGGILSLGFRGWPMRHGSVPGKKSSETFDEKVSDLRTIKSEFLTTS